LLRHNATQRKESDDLRQQLQGATENVVQSNASISVQIQNVIDQERRQAAEERRALLAQITSLINSQAEVQESRLVNKAVSIQRNVQGNTTVLKGSMMQYTQGMDNWNAREGQFLEEMATSSETLKSKLQDDWDVSSTHQTPIWRPLLT
jgi:kinesin family member 11